MNECDECRNSGEHEKDIHYRCADIYALEVISGKWRLAIIWTLASKESMRYNELKRHLRGITNIMLTRALRSLEEHDLVIRNEFKQIPPHVEYSLTPKCREVLPALKIIHSWGRDLLSVYNARQLAKA